MLTETIIKWSYPHTWIKVNNTSYISSMITSDCDREMIISPQLSPYNIYRYFKNILKLVSINTWDVIFAN